MKKLLVLMIALFGLCGCHPPHEDRLYTVVIGMPQLGKDVYVESNFDSTAEDLWSFNYYVHPNSGCFWIYQGNAPYVCRSGEVLKAHILSRYPDACFYFYEAVIVEPDAGQDSWKKTYNKGELLGVLPVSDMELTLDQCTGIVLGELDLTSYTMYFSVNAYSLDF